MSFSEDLKRLKHSLIVRTVITYGVIAAGVIDVAGNALPHLGLPAWTVTMVILIAVLGFPIAILIAWNVTRKLPPERLRARWFNNVLVYGAPLAVLVVAYLLARGSMFAKIDDDAKRVAADTTAAPISSPPAASIAVLPFVDLSPNRDHEYFSDGITEELTTALSLLPGVKVAARTSASQFKNAGTNVTEIGKRLAVATVLEGSIRRAGESLRVTAQWIDARNGYHLWARNFDARLTDVFAIQDSIANAVAKTLGTRLAQMDTVKGSSRDTRDVIAYDLYLKGRHLQQKGDSASVAKAVAVLNQAIKRDPGYSIAYRSLAGAYTTLARTGDTTAYAKARAATNRARTLTSSRITPRALTPVVATPSAPSPRPAAYDSALNAALSAGDRAAAIKIVEEALANGTVTKEDLKRDTIYNPLRRSIRFAKLLQ